MLSKIIDPTNPQATVDNAAKSIAGFVGLAGYALGLNGIDMQTISQNGIPRWVVGVTALAAGAVAFARFAPESWIAQIRDFGVRH